MKYRYSLKPQRKRRLLETVRGTVLILGIIVTLIAYIGFEHENAYKASIEADVYHELLIQHQSVAEDKDSQIQDLKTQIEKLKRLVSLPDDQKMALQIKQYFPNDYKTALMVFKHESGLNPYAQNWNCYYFNVSRSCTIVDRWRAWSVDCGLTQENFTGTTCPKESFNVDWNLNLARSKYASRGWQPWSAYNNGNYLQSAQWADQIMADQQQLIALGVI